MKKHQKTGPSDSGFLLDDYILYNLNRSAGVYNNEMSKALKSHGLSTMQWRILMILSDKSPSSVTELSRRSVQKMPTITKMLDRMERDGLVVRTAFESDRRIVEVTMTPKAAKVLRSVQAIGQGVFERAFEDVSAKDIDVVTDVLKRVRKNLQRSPYETAQRQPKKRA